MATPAGYSWLIQRYALRPVQPLRRASLIGTSRLTQTNDGYCRETYPPQYQPDDTFEGHMTFALKYEGVYPEVLSCLFGAIGEEAVVNWVLNERMGQYARRTGFLYEWFTGTTLRAVEPLHQGNYVNAIDPSIQLAATDSRNNQRWRVRDNMPGTRGFLPLVFRSPSIQAVEAYNCADELEALNVEFGADVLLRSAVWLTIKESRSSFIIEHEEKRVDDIKRFARAMEYNCGVAANPLAEDALIALQKEIIGSRTTVQHFGFRQSPVFVGSVANYENIVHYVAPHWDDLNFMLAGVEIFLERTKGVSPVIRAAVASFAFVYIHPLVDGNGRAHRFLINDILRRDGAVPSPYILPISATITHSAVERARYDAVLDVFSKPFMSQNGSACNFGPRATYRDGIESDFEFAAYPTAQHAWRYMDLTAHVEYLADIINKTIREEMTNEARIMRDWTRARIEVKKVIDGPDQDIDRIVRSVRDNNGMISNSLKTQFPVLQNDEIAKELVEAVASVFPPAGTLRHTAANQDEFSP